MSEEDIMSEQKQETTQQNDENVVVVEETFWGTFGKIFKIFVIVVVGFVILLVGIGMAMGFAGIRPPTIDSNALTNPFTDTSSSPEEHSPNVTPTQQSTITAEPTTSGGTINETQYENAYEAGKIAGELYAEYEGEESDFWKGFNTESLKNK